MIDTSCPHCGCEIAPFREKGDVIRYSCRNPLVPNSAPRGLLCVEREAHNNTKRERDEARAHWGTESMNAAQFLSEKTKAIAERDEARADAHNYREGYHIYSLQADSAGRERDEAQERECAAIESWWEEHQRALREGQRVVEAREQNAKLLEETITYWKERERIALNAASEHSESVSKLHRRAQRVEAQNAKLREIAEWAVDNIFHKCTEDLIRAELEELKQLK